MKITVPGEPIPKARPRFSKHGHVYTPRETVEYESAVAWSAKASGCKFGKRELRLDVQFYCSSFRKDTDNLIKSVCDSVQLAGVVEDDCYITVIFAERFVDKRNPRTEISLNYWEPDA